MSAAERNDDDPCVDLEEAARMVRRSVRAMERRRTWEPPFPEPISHRPLVWRREDIREWVDRASILAAKRAKKKAA